MATIRYSIRQKKWTVTWKVRGATFHPECTSKEAALSFSEIQRTISRCRPLVLSLWAKINTSLQDGWSLRSVWKALKDTGKYPSSYESFRANVRTLQGTGGKVESPIPSGQKAVTPEKKPETPPASQTSTALKEFSVKGVDGNPAKKDDPTLF